MIGHDLKRKQFNLIPLQCFGENLFKGKEIPFLVKDRHAHVGSVEGMVDAARFVSSW